MTSHAQARLEATVFGLVQGVFFRQSTWREANHLSLVGWVANQPDGSVRVVAEGDEAVVRKLLDYLHHGPAGARVNRVETAWSTATGEFTDFRVRYL